MNNPVFILAAARELAASFEDRTREDGTRFVSHKDNSPEWTLDAIQEAHGGKLPNDWSYTTARQVTDDIVETLEYDLEADLLDEARHEIIGGCVSVYHGDRFAWLASHGTRSDYCDMAMEEGLVAEHASMSDRIAAGMYQEAAEIFHAIFEAISGRAEELEAASNTDEEA